MRRRKKTAKAKIDKKSSAWLWLGGKKEPIPQPGCGGEKCGEGDVPPEFPRAPVWAAMEGITIIQGFTFVLRILLITNWIKYIYILYISYVFLFF